MKIFAVTLKNDSAVFGLRWTRKSAETLAELVVATSRDQLSIDDFVFQELTIPSFHIKLEEILGNLGIEIVKTQDRFVGDEHILVLRAYLMSMHSHDRGYLQWEDPVLTGVEMLLNANPGIVEKCGVATTGSIVVESKNEQLLESFAKER